MSAIRAIVSDFGGVLTTPLFHAFARVQDDSGIPLADFAPDASLRTRILVDNPQTLYDFS